MLVKYPKNTDKYFWTEHVKFKMRFYGLSPQKVLGIISKPQRKEVGIVENTIAVMQPISPKNISGKIVWKQEVWAMYVTKIKNQRSKIKITNQNSKFNDKSQINIISAWRYPGVSPKNNPIPENILEELESLSSAPGRDII